MSELFHVESEQSVLGGLLIDPNSIDRIDWLQPADFYREDHRTVFTHIIALLADRKPVDVVTVAESLLSSGIQESVIGLPYLGELAMNTPSAANIVRYAEVVSEKRMLRDLLSASNQIAEIATGDDGMPAAQRIDEAASIVFKLSERGGREDDVENIGSILSSVVEDIQERHDRDGGISGLASGFSDLDAKTCGFNGGDLVIIAGRPSMGKTAIAINIAEHVAVNDGKSVLVFSMEMGKKQLTERCIASIGGISMNAIRSGKLSDDDYSMLSYAMGKMFHAKLVIDDRPALTIAQMRAKARRVAKKNGSLDLIVVDYIQLARGDSIGKNSSREQEVSSISRGLKAIAKEFNCPMIALSQLSRKVEERADKRPMMSDLRESGAIEQDADVIMMMYRDEYYNPGSPEKGMAEIIIAKQRMGETGVVPVMFQGEFSRFRNLSHEDRITAQRAWSERQENQVARPKKHQPRGVE